MDLQRFTPNREKYSASKISESLIKIKQNQFCKLLEENFYLEKNLKKEKIKNNYNNIENIITLRSSNTNNYLYSSNSPSSFSLVQSTTESQRNETKKGLHSEISSLLSNIFKFNSIKYIQILINILFLVTFFIVLIEFLISYNYINTLKVKIDFLNNGYIISNDILYIKYFVTEGIISNSISNYICSKFSGGNSLFLDDIKNELSFYRQELIERINTFSSSEICKEYKYFIENNKIKMYTLTINAEENITLQFNTGMSRISAALNNLITNPSLMIKSNRDSYELIYNLLNDFYIYLENVIEILLNDSIKSTNFKFPFIIIIFFYFIILLIIFIIFIQLLSRFAVEREKPLNLFMTLKKRVFENLKFYAENFSNKLLNKFFENEENDDEESQQLDYETKIQENDINIIKFKGTNKYNFSVNKAFYFIKFIIIIFIFFIFFLFYIIGKFCDFRYRMEKIKNFITLFNKNNLVQLDYVLSLDIFKSYLFNKSIPILNKKDTHKEFFEIFLNLTHKFEQSIIYNVKKKSFLKGKYLEKFWQYMLGDYTELLEKEYVEKNRLFGVIRKGLKPVITRAYELIRYYTIKYCNLIKTNNENIESDEISKILKDTEFKLYEINQLIQKVVRNWYSGFLKLMIKYYYDFLSRTKFIYIIFFVLMIIIIILYYCIIWKTYEIKLINLLKESTNLINLIPKEIKNILIEKINE